MQLEQVALEQLKNAKMPKPQHLGECGFCMSTYLQMIEYYTQSLAELNTIDQSSRESTINQKLQLHGENTYRFNYIHILQAKEAIPRYTKTLVADAGISTVSDPIKNVGVFASGDERLMVRILRGAEDDYSLYLLSDLKELYQNVLVRIVGFDHDYVSDTNGCVKLGNIDLPETENLGIEVRSTGETYDLKNVFPGVGALLGESQITVKHSEDHRLKMEIISIEGKFNLKITISESVQDDGLNHVKILAVKNEIHTEVKDFVRGVALFEDIQDPADLQLKIFA
jgi:hypothetical protein